MIIYQIIVLFWTFIFTISSSIFIKIGTNNHNYLVKSKNRIKCLAKCFKTSACAFVSESNLECKLYSASALYEPSDSSRLYQKLFDKPKLLYFWHFQNGQIKELINSAKINKKHNFFNTTDRFGNINSAFRLQSGHLELEPITRLGFNVSVVAWVKLNSRRDNQRFIDFGNGANRDNLIISMTGSTTPLFFRAFIGSVGYGHNTNIFLPQFNWQHLGLVVEGGSFFIYLNGSLVDSTNFGVQNVLRKINRTRCYIGKSNWQDLDVDGDFDEIKIFDGALNADQIKDESLADF